MKRIAIAVIMVTNIIVAISVAEALERKHISMIDSDQLTIETQISGPGGDEHFNLVWWIPIEFWQAIFARDKTTSEFDKKNIITALNPYSLLAVCQADISSLGAFRFYNKDEIEKSLSVNFKDRNGNLSRVNPPKDIDPDIEVLIGIFKPILSAAAGNMGQNFHFFVLKDYDSSGTRRMDPYSTGTIKFHLAKRSGELIETQLDFPLNSLYIPRRCPNGKEAHVTWRYCPWTGKKLED
ncbi:MAG: hypothetical protein AB1Z29_19380 [Desulfobacterales bacterium]